MLVDMPADAPLPSADLVASLERVLNIAGKRPAAEVYIGRSFAGRVSEGWGNPAKVASNSLKARINAVTAFHDYLANDTALLEKSRTLEGKTLGCWCAPKLCHGHILATVADGLNAETSAWVRELKEYAEQLPYRLLVTGSRSWTDREMMRKALNERWAAWGKPKNIILVHGAARGADSMAEELWQKAGFSAEPYPADWGVLGKKAGILRNLEMIQSGVDWCLGFDLGGPGTAHCMKAAEKAGVPVTAFRS